jgi:hypothetical protein
MKEGPEWFAPKTYGYGAGLPIAWQGWALLAGFMAFVTGMAFLLADRPLALMAAMVPATLMFVIIVKATTRGKWRWRWGKGNKND